LARPSTKAKKFCGKASHSLFCSTFEINVKNHGASKSVVYHFERRETSTGAMPNKMWRNALLKKTLSHTQQEQQFFLTEISQK